MKGKMKAICKGAIVAIVGGLIWAFVFFQMYIIMNMALLK